MCPPVRKADTQVGPYTRPAIDRPTWAVLISVIAFLLVVTGCMAHAQTPFYQGKTITLIVGSAPGGTGDLRIKATLP